MGIATRSSALQGIFTSALIPALITFARTLSLPRIRSVFSFAPAALFAVLVGAFVTSCRPAADPTPLGPEVRLAIQAKPANARVGVPLGTPAVIQVLDRDDQQIVQAGATVRATVTSGSAQIAAGGEVSASDGAATFSSLVLVGTAGANIRLGFQLFKDGVATDISILGDTFRLQTGPAATIATQPPSSITGTAGQVVTPAPSVIVKDAGGNVVSGASVTFQITAGEGRLTGAAESVTNAQGVAAVSGWVLGLPGTNVMKASVATPQLTSPTQDATFSAAVTTTAGMLRIRVTGTTAGATARVRVLKTSAAGAIHDAFYNVTDSLTVTGLPFGTYQVTGDTLVVGTRTWAGDASITGLNVSSSSGPSVIINYRELGRFEITARGLPTPQQTGVVDFLPTAGDFAAAFQVNVLNDAITRSLGPIGTYDVVPRVVVVAGQQYAGTPARQSVVLSGGSALAQMTINYSVTTGTLNVVLAGTIPAGAAPQIDVTGPGGFHETVFTSGRSWTGLVPGSYTVTASQITVANVLYRPAPVTAVHVVTAGNVTTATITYNP